MHLHELQTTVLVEGVCAVLMLLIILSSYYRWRIIFYASSTAVTIAFFSIWHVFMAIGSLLVYGPASLMMWLELDRKSKLKDGRMYRYIRIVCWLSIATGVSFLVLKNIFNILNYLSQKDC